MSMAASEYLSTRSEQTAKHPVRAPIYTGIAYILTVSLLVLPYLLLENYYLGGEGPYAVLLAARFKAACRRFGLNEACGPELDCSRFIRDPGAPRQCEMFG